MARIVEKCERFLLYLCAFFFFSINRVKCIGFARRRRGRGGRIVLDRISTNMDEFWANLDYTIYSGGTKLTAKEICRQNELKKLQQQESIIRDKSQSIVIDLEPTNLPRTSSVSERANTTSDDKMDNIVIKSEEKTALTVNENFDAVNRTKSDNANNAVVGKHFDLKRNDVNITTTTFDAITNRNNGTVNIINTDNNNNSGNNSSSSSKNNSNNNSSSNANSRLSNINNTFRLPSNASGNVRRRLSLAPSSSSSFGSSLSFAENSVDAPDTMSPLFHQSNKCLSSKT